MYILILLTLSGTTLLDAEAYQKQYTLETDCKGDFAKVGQHRMLPPGHVLVPTCVLLPAPVASTAEPQV
jgi:hypothetical protein